MMGRSLSFFFEEYANVVEEQTGQSEESLMHSLPEVRWQPPKNPSCLLLRNVIIEPLITVSLLGLLIILEILYLATNTDATFL